MAIITELQGEGSYEHDCKKKDCYYCAMFPKPVVSEAPVIIPETKPIREIKIKPRKRIIK